MRLLITKTPISIYFMIPSERKIHIHPFDQQIMIFKKKKKKKFNRLRPITDRDMLSKSKNYNQVVLITTSFRLWQAQQQ